MYVLKIYTQLHDFKCQFLSNNDKYNDNKNTSTNRNPSWRMRSTKFSGILRSKQIT